MQIVKAYLSIWEMGKPVGEGGGGLQNMLAHLIHRNNLHLCNERQ